jgi:hypothetical protein
MNQAEFKSLNETRRNNDKDDKELQNQVSQQEKTRRRNVSYC